VYNYIRTEFSAERKKKTNGNVETWIGALFLFPTYPHPAFSMKHENVMQNTNKTIKRIARVYVQARISTVVPLTKKL
jgi:hypothetical protein